MDEEDNLLAKLDEIERVLPETTTVRDAAKLLILATNVAQKAALRYLIIEARLGELIKSEQEARNKP